MDRGDMESGDRLRQGLSGLRALLCNDARQAVESNGLNQVPKRWKPNNFRSWFRRNGPSQSAGRASPRRVFPPPVPRGTPVDPGGADSATRAFRRQQQVSDLYSRWRADHSPDIDPDVLKDNAGAFSVSDAALTLPDALAAVKDDAESATKRANDLIKGNRVDNSNVASQLAARDFGTGHGGR